MASNSMPQDQVYNHEIESQAMVEEMDATLSSYLYQAQNFHLDLDTPYYVFMEMDKQTEIKALVLNPYNGQVEGPGLGDTEGGDYFETPNSMAYDPGLFQQFDLAQSGMSDQNDNTNLNSQEVTENTEVDLMELNG